MGRSFTYRLLMAQDPAKLSDDVNKLLDQGWNLYEGPLMAAVPINGSRHPQVVYCQAMRCWPEDVAKAQGTKIK